MNNNQKFGTALIIIGVTLLIISQSANFYYEDYETLPNPFGGTGFSIPVTKHNDALKNGLLYGGLALAVIGSFVALMTQQASQPKLSRTEKSIFCSECGKRQTDNRGTFCEECGNKL